MILLLASIFLNGVNIDSLRGQSFEKCKTVKIDDRGDVFLDCPGYQVQQQAPPATPAPVVPAAVATAITKHYWMVSEDANSAQAQYDLDVFINAKWVRKISDGPISRGSISTAAPPRRSAMISAVRRVRPSGLATIRQPASPRVRFRKRSPNARACSRPLGVSAESTWPCNRRSRLKIVSPCRTR